MTVKDLIKLDIDFNDFNQKWMRVKYKSYSYVLWPSSRDTYSIHIDKIFQNIVSYTIKVDSLSPK